VGYKDYEIVLSSGRVVRLQGFHVARTYVGLLEGAPDADYNRRVLASARERVTRLWGDRPTYLIDPEPHSEFLTGRVCVRLPEITYHAWLESGPIDQVFAYSELVVSWFGPYAGETPIPKLVHQAIRDLPWEPLARGCDP
jgi:hypothetical protein